MGNVCVVIIKCINYKICCNYKMGKMCVACSKHNYYPSNIDCNNTLNKLYNIHYEIWDGEIT